ncbi:MSMEG_6728 family protein [Virgisporangium aliadipatigenens]|nr:MSMEG_6728 family protein [Virgisporangium aliadipatigenens]
MQTFLPYADFADSARALDPKRLGKQRVETLQVLRGLTVANYGWRHHPAVKMWHGYTEALVRYGLEMCAAWRATGRADTVADTLRTEYDRPVRTQAELARVAALPPWLGDAAFHRSHRSSLLRKDPAHYRPLWPDDPDDLDYVWPTPGIDA